MSLFAFAEEYVTEFYENRLAEEGLAVSDLSPRDHAALLDLISSEISQLHGMLTMSCESWATDADIFEPEQENTA